MGDRKRARTAARPNFLAPIDEGLGGLYDFLPAPDPVKDELAKVSSSKNHLARPKLPPEDKNRVIFLDVDGVLLPVGSFETVEIDGMRVPVKDYVTENDFPSGALGNLRSIVQQTGATIVLSSEWRRTEKMKLSLNAIMKSQDIPMLRDATVIFQPKYELASRNPILGWCERRAREIGKWLKDHPEVTSWVALDDLDFSMADSVRAAGTPWIKYRSVHTHDKHCLTEDDATAAVQILLNPPPEPVPIKKRARGSEQEDGQDFL